MACNYSLRLKEAKLATKNDIANFIKKTDFDDKLKMSIKKLLQNKTNRGWKETEWAIRKR